MQQEGILDDLERLTKGIVYVNEQSSSPPKETTHNVDPVPTTLFDTLEQDIKTFQHQYTHEVTRLQDRLDTNDLLAQQFESDTGHSIQHVKE